jgi:hypothetical protein
MLPLLLLSLPLSATATTLYVDVNCTNSTPPYTNWVTAATNIQDAVDASLAGDDVLVTNGVYQTGGATLSFISNRVAVTKPLTIQSVNGPAATIIMGSHGNVPLGIPYVRCAYLTNGATFIGFTLTNGSVASSVSGGGGVLSSGRPPLTPTSVINCILIGNSAHTDGGGACGVFLDNCMLTGNSANTGGGAYACGLNNCIISSNTASGSGAEPSDLGSGGGAYRCNMTNCLITGNSASQAGGGASGGLLNNCTVTSNTAYSGGGVSLPASGATYLTNCVVFYNSATAGSNYQAGPVFSHCCTMPLPAGAGNITNEPDFLNLTAGDFHLQTNSPCINAGLNSAVASATDLEGNPRIVGGAVDIGAYECQSPTLLDYYLWLQSYGLPTAASATYADSDSDGMNNWQEWICGTDPTNSLSVLTMLAPSNSVSGLTVNWQGVSNRTYFLECSTNLLVQPAFTRIQSNIVGKSGTTSFTDTNAAGAGPFFYRVGVNPP